MYVTQLLSNSMNPSFHLQPIVSPPHVRARAHTCSSDVPQLHPLPLLNLHGRSKFFLLRTNNYASGTLGWIFKSSVFLLTRTCLLFCPAVGSMWCTKPRLSTPSTGPGWKANWENAQLHAPSIHYPVIVMPPQLLESSVSKIASLRMQSGSTSRWASLSDGHVCGSIIKWSLIHFKDRRFFD